MFKTMMKSVAVGAALTLVAPGAWAGDVTFMARPSASTLPLFVVQAKAGDFLPDGTDVVGALKTEDVDCVTMLHGLVPGITDPGNAA